MAIKAPSQAIQDRAVAHVNQVFSNFSTLLTGYRTTWQRLFRATYVFETDRKGAGKSQIFFPKCYEQVEKIHARITGNDPRFALNLHSPVNPSNPEMDMWAAMNYAQLGLNYFWKMGNCQEKLEDLAKQGLIYNIAWARVDFEQKLFRRTGEEVLPNGETREVEIEEILSEFPTFDVPDIFDVYFDPRIRHVADMQAIIERKDQVLKEELLSRPDLYFNLAQVEKLFTPEFTSTSDNFKQNKLSQQGISLVDAGAAENLSLTDYYGYFAEKEGGEPSLYRLTLVGDSVLVRMEELKFIPFECFVPTNIPNQTVGKGVVEPVKALQDAYNLTRNQRFENVSLVMNRMWILKQGSGVDPRRLVSVAGNVILAKDPEGIMPLVTPDVTASAYNEALAINTEIQAALGTIDASQDSGAQSFSNTATGEKIRWAEYNARFKAIKRSLERALSRIGEKMLMMVAERATINPKVADPVTKQFYEVAKEAFNSVSDFYSVSVVADSTSYDTLENRRDNELAFLQMAVTLKSQGVPVDVSKLWHDIALEFGKVPNDYLMAAPEQPQGGPSIPQKTVEAAQGVPSPEDQLNEQLTNV